MRPTGCPEQKTLAALDAGLLSGDELAAVAAHLDRCPSCLAKAQAAALATDPLVAALCRPGPADTYVQEACCDQAMAQIRALAADVATEAPNILTPGSRPKHSV